MDNNIMKKLSEMLSKMPKKDLEAKLNQAKDLLKNSNKEDLQKLINSKEVIKILGKDTDKLKNAIDNDEIKVSDVDSLLKNN
ncbi:MAG: hypothetical protein IJS47_02815 [Clostridia bacterium]|nr:hypothetical protein [Clostridia bacterium]